MNHSYFMPHGYCYLWDPHMVWLHVISDGLIALSYFCIPIALVYLGRKRRDLPFNWIFLMFGAFIVGCGITHFMEIWTIWHASYLLSGVIKAATAAISVVTAVMMIPLIPRAIALPSPVQLQALNHQLEIQISEREQTLAQLAERKSAVGELQAAQTALRESQARIDAIIQSAMDGIIAVDEQQHVLIFNAAAEKMFGCLASEAVGGPIERLIPQRFRSTHGSHIRRFSETGTTSRTMGTLGAIWGLRANGEEFPLEASISQVETGGKKLFTVILRDISERKRAEEALTESLAASKAALKELADQKFALDQHAIVEVTDTQGTITYVNDKFCAISQYSREELIGQNHRFLNSGHHSEQFFQQMYHAIANGNVWHGEIRNRAKDGSIYWVDTTVLPFVGTDGKPRQYVAIRTDITERKVAGEILAAQAEELARQVEELAHSRQAMESQSVMLQSVLDNMAEGLVAADSQGKFLIWNKSAEKILGFGLTNLPAEDWSRHYGTYLPDGVTRVPTEQLPLVRAMRGEANSCEIFVRNAKVAQGAWIEASGSPLKGQDGVVHGGVVAFRDISQRKADEQKIRQLNDSLELKVVERTAQLVTANKELEAFSYSVSHDLRAPLRHISGFSKMLEEEFGPSLSPDARHYVERIQAGTLKMGLLVDGLLNLAKVGRHTLSVQPIRLNSLVAEVIAMLQPECSGRQIEWIIAELPPAECDPILVKQIFQNLLANALKFTRPRTRAIIEVSHREENGQSVFLIRDNGVGFNMKYVGKLFGVFQRLHKEDEFEGTGIGLVTVQRIVHRHGGRVWAEGVPEQGAVFHFTLSVGEQVELKSNEATAGGQK